MLKLIAAVLLLTGLSAFAVTGPTRVHIYEGTFRTLSGTVDGPAEVDRGACVVVFDEEDATFRITYSYRHGNHKLYRTQTLSAAGNSLNEAQSAVKVGRHQQFTDTFVSSVTDGPIETDTLFYLSGPIGTVKLASQPAPAESAIPLTLTGSYILNVSGTNANVTHTDIIVHLETGKSREANNNGETGAQVTTAVQSNLISRGFEAAP